MRDITLVVRQGPHGQESFTRRLGRVTLGREPGVDGILLAGDPGVSRIHGELLARGPSIFYRNRSSNGSLVNGEVAHDTVRLEPGSEIRIGSGYVLQVDFEATPRPPTIPTGRLSEPEEPWWRSGPLERPVVRLVLLVYLLGLAALAVFFGLRHEPDLLAEFAAVRETYEADYLVREFSPENRAERIERVDRLLIELQALERMEDWEEARRACRALMALDGDPASPVYRFAAHRHAELTGRR